MHIEMDIPESAFSALRLSPPQFARELRNDATLRVDVCGYPFYVEPASTAGSNLQPQAAIKSDGSLDPSGDVFALASRPGSPRTIYLNFKGATVSGTAWNVSYNGGAPIVAPAFSLDADGSTFTTAEQDVIRATWLRVAEDYASFDVNVTTADPGAEAIDRTSSADTVYGAVALITNDSLIYGNCGCGGIAFVGVFNRAGDHAYYQPAWVFQRGLGGSAKNMAEAASHEIGHNLGLSHDGAVAHDTVGAVGYYTGQGAWAPIMGVGYYKPVSQWSKGEYNYANQTQDDLAIINSSGVVTLADDHGGSAATASTLSTSGAVGGIISTAGDTDWFVFNGSGPTTISAAAQATGPNLDIGLSLYDATGALLASADPAVAMTSASVATGLDAAVSVTLAAGTYYVKVDGVGYGTAAATGYSDYASLGRYSVALTTTPPPTTPVVVTTASLPGGTAMVAYSATLAASGGTAPYSWSVDAGTLPDGLSLDSAGVISGTPTTAGTYSVTVRVSDASAQSATAVLTIVVAAAPVAVTTGSLASGQVGVAYRATLAASGGTAPYTWALAAGALPDGLTLSPAGVISGTPTAATTAGFTVQATDTMAASATRSLTLTIAAAPLVMNTTTLPAGKVATAYSATLVASGGTPPYTWSRSGGNLPNGLTLSSAGVLSGKPTKSGTSTFNISVTDAKAGVVKRSFSVTISR
jgi:hypothetical protein